MGRYTPETTRTVGLVDHLLSVSGLYIQQTQRYIFRWIELQKIVHQMMEELPDARQSYYKELISGIDNRIRSAYYGTQGNDHGTT